jgi:hypothetical protein
MSRVSVMAAFRGQLYYHTRKIATTYRAFLAPCVAAFPLQDALLPTTRVVTGLVKWMQYLTNTDNHKVGMSKVGTYNSNGCCRMFRIGCV